MASVTPKIGYSFNTPVEDHSLKLDKDAMFYGVGITKTLLGKFALELEVTQIDSNYDSQFLIGVDFNFFGIRQAVFSIEIQNFTKMVTSHCWCIK